MVSPPNFDHEKLDVYQLELKFLTWVTQFLAEICGPLSAQLSNAQPAWMLLWPKDLLFFERIQPGKEMLVRIVAMLTKLVGRVALDQSRVGEGASDLTASFESEDEDDDEYPGKA